MKLLLILIVAFSSVCYSQELSSLYRDNQIIFYGENHLVHEHHDPIFSTLENALARGEAFTFATEYFIGSEQPRFNEYLQSQDSGPGTKLEKEFFDFLKNDLGVSWTDSERNREYFRRLRRLKQTYGKKFNVCAIDYQNPRSVRGDYDEEDKPGAKLKSHIRKIYSNLDSKIVSKLLETFGGSLEEIIEDGSMYYREGSMAQNLHNCGIESEKALVHTGMFHNHRHDAPVEDWWTLSRLYSLLSPARLVTVANLRIFLDPQEDYVFWKRLEKVGALFTNSTMISREELSGGIRDLLRIQQDEEVFDSSEIWDYFILGPAGTKLEESTSGR